MLIFDCQSASAGAGAGAGACAGVRVVGNSLRSVCWRWFVDDALRLIPGGLGLGLGLDLIVRCFFCLLHYFCLVVFLCVPGTSKSMV